MARFVVFARAVLDTRLRRRWREDARRFGVLVCVGAIALACGEGEPDYDAADFAPPVEAAPPTGTWEHAAPPSTEELARQIAQEMQALEASGYLGDESDSGSESGSFTGTVPPPVAFGVPGGFGANPSQSGTATEWQGGSASGWQGGSATAGQGGYEEPGAFRGQAEVGGVPLVGGTVDQSGGGNSVYSVGGKVIELP